MIYFILSILLFLKCGYPLLVKQIKEIVQSKKSNKNQNKIQDINKKNSNKKNSSNKKKDNAPPKKSGKINSNSKFIFNNINNNNLGNILPGKHNNNNLIKRNNKKNRSRHKRKNSHLKTANNIYNKSKIKVDKKNSDEYNHFELNTLEYLNAINYDKRTFCQYYGALIRIKHPLLFGLCPINDYNSMIIKLCIFLLSFDIYYVINFIFFDENAIHNLYENG